MAYIYKALIDSTNYLIEPRLYTTATLETGANNSKYYTASIADFELIDGVLISIKIPSNANGTGLKIGSNEAIPIYYNGSNIETGLLLLNRIYSFIYANNVWNLVGDIDSPRAPMEHTHILNEITDAIDLKVIEELTGTAGFLKKTGTNLWTLDNTNYTTNTGTVTSVLVQASEPLLSSTNSALNTSLNTTISFKNLLPNKVLAGPSTGSDSGAPTFRSLVLADLPTGTGATQVAIGNHVHGNITSDGKLSTANRMVYTNGSNEITVSSHTVETNKLTVNISSDDTTDKKRFKVLGNNRFLSIGGSGIQAYSTSNNVDTASKLYLLYNGGNLEIGQSSVSSAITGNFYGAFNFRTAGGFVYVGIQATNTSSTNLSRPIWFSAAENSTKYIAGTPVYDNTFKYNPKNQTLSIGNGTLTGANYSGKAATAGVADSANAVTWEHVSEKPSTATSWPTFAQVKDKPTTLEGYGITDAAPINSPTFTGTPKSVTPSSNSDSKMIATKEYVDGIVAVADALVYKGVLAGANADTNGGTLTPAANRGDTYKVSTAGYINGDYVEVGDMLICLTDNTAAATTSGDNIYTTIKTNWNVILTSEGTVSSSVTNSTDNGIARFDGTSGRLIQDSSITIDDNGHISITHAAGESGELRIKYSTTIDYWWGVGSGNENHGLYDVKANKWILSAGTANTWTFAGTANLATTVTTTADTTNALYPVGVTSSATSTLKRDTSITMTGGTINASALEIGASGKYVNFTSSGIKLGDSGTAVSNGANLITVNGHMVVNGTYNTANNYSEGIRINRSSNGWAEVTMGGALGTTSGTGLGVWLVGTYATPHNGTTAAANITDSKFYIAYNGSNTATCRITGENDNGFSIRPRLSINDDVDTNYTFKSNGKSWITGPLHIGNTDTAGTGTGLNGYTINNSGSNNYIAFYGVYNDNPGSFNHTYIGESIYGSKTAANEKSELLLFHGNDASSSSGPDRIRLFAAQVDILVYTSTTAGTWDSIRATNGILVANFASEKLTITGNIVPDATNSNRTLGTSSLKWANTYSTSFTGDTIYLANDSSSAYNSKGIQFAGGSRIGEGNSSNGLGIYGVDTIYIRPDTNGSAGSEGVLIDSDGLYPSNNNSEKLGLSDHKWSNVYATTFTGDLSGNASTATSATKDSAGNTISSYYCTLSTDQTLSGKKTFSANVTMNGDLSITKSAPILKMQGSSSSAVSLILERHNGTNLISSWKWVNSSGTLTLQNNWSSGTYFNVVTYKHTSGLVQINSDDDSTSTSTGALLVSGGAGIGKTLYVGTSIVRVAPDSGVDYITGSLGTTAALHAKRKANTKQWNPAITIDTKGDSTSGNGAWQIGNYNDEHLLFVYATPANRKAGTNTVNIIDLPTTAGTIALTNDITSAIQALDSTLPTGSATNKTLTALTITDGKMTAATFSNISLPVGQLTWAGGANLKTTATANNLEWSIDLTPGDYTGTYWHVWSATKSGTILGCYPDDRHVTMPGNLTATSTTSGTLRVTGGAGFTGTVYAGGFNGPLTGNATTATSTSKLSITTITSLGSFKTDSDKYLMYTCYGGSNGIQDKPTDVDAFGCISFKNADGYQGQILLSHTGTLYHRAAANGSLNGTSWFTILDSNNYDSYALPLSGGTLTGNLLFKNSSIDASKANNNVSSTLYPTTFCILDTGDRIITRLESVVETNGNISGYWYVRNYNTSGTQVSQKGIKMTMAKDGTFTYTVSDAAKFRSAISAAESSHTHSYLPLSGGTLTGQLIIEKSSAGAIYLKRGTDPNWILAPTSSSISFCVNDTLAGTNGSFRIRGTTVDSYNDNSVDLGNSSTLWKSVHSYKYMIEEKVTLLWNSTDQSLDFIFA